MENVNKKRSEVTEDGNKTGKKIRSKKEHFNGGVTAEDAELDEFLAIINRLQAGFKYFQQKGAVKSAVTQPVTDSCLVNTAFELDDFSLEDGGRKINGEIVQNDDGDGGGGGVGFDLNADPVMSDKKFD